MTRPQFAPYVTHWIRPAGYIKGYFSEPVCGIGEKVDGWKAVGVEELKGDVTCEHCLVWLWEMDQPAKKLDLANAVDDRVVNMTFQNGIGANDLKQALKDATHEMEDEDDYEDKTWHKHAIKEAVAEMLREEWFQDDLKDVINQFLDERERRKRVENAKLFREVWAKRFDGGSSPGFFYGDTNVYPPGVHITKPDPNQRLTNSDHDRVNVEVKYPEPVTHYKKYGGRVSCGRTPTNDDDVTIFGRHVTCQPCRQVAGLKN